MKSIEDGTCGLSNITTTWKPKSSHPRSETRATSQEGKKANLQAQVSLSWPLVQPLPRTGEIHRMSLWRKRLLERYWTVAEFPCLSRGYVGKWYIMRKMCKVARATRSY